MFSAGRRRPFTFVNLLPLLASVLVILAAIWNLISWYYPLPLGLTIFTNSTRVSLLGGISFLFLGLACMVFHLRKSKTTLIISGILTLFVVVNNILILMSYFLDTHFNIEQNVFLPLLQTIYQPEMSISMLSALGFTLIGLGFLFFLGKKATLAQYIWSFALTVPITLLLGCLYSATATTFTQIYGSVPCSTSALFIILITGLLFLNPKEGLISLMISRRPGGVLIRQLVPIVVITPILLGFLRLLGEQQHWFEQKLGIALSVAVNMMIMLIICWITGRRLDTVDRYREAMKQESIRQGRLLQAIIDNTSAFVYVKDKEEKFILVNDSLLKRFKSTREQFINKSCHDIFGEHYADPYHENEQKVLTTRQAASFEEIAPIEGNDHVFVSNKFPLFDEHGEIYALGGISTDITQQKKIEDELRRTKIQAEKLADEALAASRAKSAFLAVMSHEIRTPLNGIIGMTDVLLNSELPEAQKEFVNTIQLSGWNLLDVINEILDFSKIEAGHLETEKIDFDLRNLVEDVVEILATTAHKKDIALGGLIEPDVPAWIAADPTHLRHILMNLLGNAVKFTDRGEVCLRVSVCQDEPMDGVRLKLRFDVMDTGIGMTKETIQGLFQPFSQGDSSISRKYGGTGLGLVIAKRLVDILNGNITVVSNLGIGSHFSFVLPVERAIPSATDIKDNVSPVLEGLRVLMVDDNEVNRRIVQAQTIAWKMRCDVAENAYTALVSCRSAMQEGDPYALIFIDYAMPVMDGMELAKKISTYPELAKTPLLMMTSLGKPVSTKELEEIGIQACLTKPVRQSKLYESILLALSKSSFQLLQEKPLFHMFQTTQPHEVVQPQSARILLAEDYPINQKVALQLLANLGYQADVVEDGVAVLKACTEKAYDIILMDCQMPEMDGYTATKKIRAMEKTTGQHRIIIAMTAHAMKGDKEKCLAAGMDYYLAKPVKMQELKTVLLDALASHNHFNENISAENSASKEDVESLSQELKILDFERLALLFGDDKALLLDFLALFINTNNETLTRLGSALEKQDAVQGKALAHRLKGSSANSGADEMANIAKCIEQDVLSDDWESAKCNFLKLNEAFTRLKQTLTSIV